MVNENFVNADPNPEFLIKSIAEQGYSLETALADLIDNSISADADSIEILTELIGNKLTLIISDNGIGMTTKELSDNLQFPSKSIDYVRIKSDLGRFGLGLKTASFSQTRKFTVISRKRNTNDYDALTWDVKHLKNSGKWQIIINDQSTINDLIQKYQDTSRDRLGQFKNYKPNTVIIWSGLYKFNDGTTEKHKIDLLNKQLTEVTSEYLGIVFHKFLEKKNSALQIKINHSLVIPFNPFNITEPKEIRSLGERQNKLKNEVLKMEGFILPVASTNPETEDKWRTKNMGLLDLEGIYVYRGERIIFFGGWNGLIKKEAKLKLARLRIEIGNSNDDIFQLNVAKSRIIIPHELRIAVIRYIIDLTDEAKNELSKRGIRTNSSTKGINHTDLFNRIPTSKGTLLDFNMDYPILKSISNELNPKQKKQLSLLLKIISAKFNYNKDVKDDRNVIMETDENYYTFEDIVEAIIDFKNNGWSKEKIVNAFLKDLGITMTNMPDNIKNVLSEK